MNERKVAPDHERIPAREELSNQSDNSTLTDEEKIRAIKERTVLEKQNNKNTEGGIEGETGKFNSSSVYKLKRDRKIIGLNLVVGPLLFLGGGIVAFFGNIALGHIISAILIGIGAYLARSYLSPEGRVSKVVALGVNSVTLVIAGAQLIVNYQRINTFAEHSRGDASFLGFVLPLIPVLILFLTLYFIMKSDEK